ncbi:MULTISPECIES: glutamate--cysteine ligase [unclassified Streptomyces]|uniref:glutamate--cysteine ligase n=1 Tax=Streptomyces TaxID=1883 RepID=UPI00136C8AF7|nr:MULTISPECIES: glutamate--cysteine ligase [unclassified Streptomyces]NEA00630.1 glutamate--cysteine ligase [Streptomyces sp. SID10116]MYY83840.1 glutamate--cysteine ligase [Streptomyces sp. SID335]MYZ15665.1 glutamate--cysteine ligase [Streptomyces sp. SID337]NDZ89108.1 glutamate--cysteine ligase [Streptomyces sp. SID10115]NEB50267.1 glutamate--cysteine ligase [Streptomyces sp. SID339]
MGEKVVAGTFDLADRHHYRGKLRECLAGLERMLAEERFDRPKNLMGMEIELNLAGPDGLPRMLNAQVLERIASRDFQTELGMFNLEVNIAPHRLGGRVLDRLAEELRTGLNYAHRKAAELSAGIVMIGILPTLNRADLVSANLSDVDRYALLNDQIVAARGEHFALDIQGVERLTCTSTSIAPEAACTSVQLHLQVTPGRFADVWNAAQAIAAAQIAVGANAPFLFGRELWRESRPPLFLQSTDTRSPELQTQGVRPRTWFGERWITKPLELFEENLRYFPALLPLMEEEDPLGVLDAGGVPRLGELVLHNGTVYRWNRPVYGIADGVPHLRVENRVLPAGPSITDVIANAAFYYGLVRALAEEARPVWSRLPFETAARNFDVACRHGIDATLQWPRRGRLGGTTEVAAVHLVREELLPLAAAGLDAWGVEPADRDLYLGVIEERCRRRINGASWQATTYHRARDGGMSREEALAATTKRYSELMHTGEPVHTWPVGLRGSAAPLG